MFRFISTLAVFALLVAGAPPSLAKKDGPEKKMPASAAAAVETPMPGHTHADMPLNNVVKMTALGERTALCGCGKEFVVTAETPAMSVDGMTFYACSDECANQAQSATPDNHAKMMADWNAGYVKHALADNSFAKDGEKWANCACGKELNLAENTPSVVENGLKHYYCSDQCHQMALDLPAEKRLEVDIQIVKGAAAE